MRLRFETTPNANQFLHQRQRSKNKKLKENYLSSHNIQNRNTARSHKYHNLKFENHFKYRIPITDSLRTTSEIRFIFRTNSFSFFKMAGRARAFAPKDTLNYDGA